MANKSKSNKKNIIIGACIALVILVIIILAIIFGTKGIGGINDNYFKSDDTKYVLTMDGSDIYFDDTTIAPVKVHQVYTYEGDDITSYKIYYEYADNDKAQSAYDVLAKTNDTEYKGTELKGKYVIFTANDEDYDELTPSDVKEQIDFMELLKEVNEGQDTAAEEPATEEVVEEVVEETTEETTE